MKHSIVLRLLLLFLLVSCPGCKRYINWGLDVFNQGTCLKTYKDIVKDYIRSIRIYDQFTTLGLFDALWLSDTVRTAYSRVLACKRGLSTERYRLLLHRQLQENKNFISFYVLAAIPSYLGPIIGEKEAIWSVHLCVDGRSYLPIDIKIIDLLPEYKFYFGKTFSNFKTPYSIVFNAHDKEGNPVITARTQSISLIFRRIGHQETVTWDLHSCPCIDCHPNVLMYDINDNI